MFAPPLLCFPSVEFSKEVGFFSDLSVDVKGTILLIDSIKAVVFSAAKDSNVFSPLSRSLKDYVNFPTHITTDSRGIIDVVDQNGGEITFSTRTVLSLDGN